MLEQERAREDSRQAVGVELPRTLTAELHRLASTAVHSSVRQVVVLSSVDWDPLAYEHIVWRQASKRGIGVKRIYVMPNRAVPLAQFRAHLGLDSTSGVDARSLFLSRLPQASNISALDGLWVLDESAVVRTILDDTTPALPRGWSVTDDIGEVNSGLQDWNSLWALAETREHSIAGSFDLEEPLSISADILNGVAPVLCTADHIDTTGCSWYHASWQYMRLLDLVSTPSWHAEFYSAALLDPFSSRRGVATLISGTADYSLLAYVRRAMAAASAEAEVVVLDLCPTPLFACQWYGKREGFAVKTRQASILDGSAVSAQSFDLICSDAFLTRFPTTLALEVLNRWKDLLRPRGRIVTTVRVHESHNLVRSTEDAIVEFKERARVRAGRWRAFVRKTPAEIAELAETYARKMRSESLGDVQDIRSLFDEAGLSVSSIEEASVAGELYPTNYARIIATRRNEGGTQ